MKYKYYGTAAAEGIPALWCDCEVCERARKKGGKNVMSRSQQTIDDKILIDFSADTFMHTTHGLSLKNIHTCIITHNHADHFYPEDITMRFGWFAYIKDETPLSIYSMKPGIEHLKSLLDGSYVFEMTPKRVKMNEIIPFNSFVSEGYKITPLKANHDPKSGCVIYLIEKDGKCVLHANDTGYFPEETWSYLGNNAKHIDFASFDCNEPGSNVDNNKTNGHMNCSTVKNVRSRLHEMKLIDDNSICVINNFSHNGKYIYDELLDLAKSDGFLVSYDGMEVEF